MVKNVDSEGSLPLFMKYNQTSNQLTILATKTKELGNYELMMCLSDGYAKSTCSSFKVTVEDPMKSKIAKMTSI